MENAGNLKPGARYIYERADGAVYAREFGTSERILIGYDYEKKTLQQELQDAKLWGEIHRAAVNNPALQDALDRVKLIYALSKQDKTVPHHPV
jgi:hypothetical protein